MIIVIMSCPVLCLKQSKQTDVLYFHLNVDEASTLLGSLLSNMSLCGVK